MVTLYLNRRSHISYISFSASIRWISRFNFDFRMALKSAVQSTLSTLLQNGAPLSGQDSARLWGIFVFKVVANIFHRDKLNTFVLLEIFNES